MARIDSDLPPAVSPAAASAADPGGAAIDLGAVPPEILAHSLAEYVRGWWVKVRAGDSGVLPVVLGIVVVAVVFQVVNAKFLSPQNLVNLFEQSSIYMLLAMAEIFALLLAEIDLSVGLVMGLAAVVVAELVQPSAPASCQFCTHGLAWPAWLAIAVTLLIAAGVGAIQGTLVARFRMPSFIVTLGTLLVLEGVAIIVLHGSAVAVSNKYVSGERTIYDIFWGVFSPLVSWILLILVVAVTAAALLRRDLSKRRRGLVTPPLGITLLRILLLAGAGALVVGLSNVNRAHVGTIEGVPFIIAIVLALLFIYTILLQRTRFGRYVYAIGGNPEAARRAGVKLTSVRIWCFVLAALTSGVAGILFASWQVSITVNIIQAANGYVLLAVAAAVIGGTSLFGGRGRTIHGVLGGLVIGGIYNGLYLIGVPSAWIDVAVAGVLVAAGTIDVLSRRTARSQA